MRSLSLAMIFTGFFGVGIGLIPFAWARQDIIPGSRYTSARGAALGDAALPLGEDISSGLFYNPAILGKIRKTQLEPINVSIYANNYYISSVDANFYSVTNLSGFIPTLNKHLGKLQGVGGAIMPSFGFPGFGLGVLLQSQVAAQANGDGTITYKSLYQLIPAIGTGFRLLNGVIRLGYSLQWVNQAVGTQTVSDGSDPAYGKSLLQGSGFSHTAGLAVTIPMQFLPAFNLVVRNILNTQYSESSIPLSQSVQGVPATEAMSFDSSFSLQPKLGQGASMTLIAQYRDMTNTSGVTLMGHLAFGAELSFRDRFFLRAGFGSGYPTAGLAFKRTGAEIALTYYAEEIGASYLGQRDTRFMLQYQLRAF